MNKQSKQLCVLFFLVIATVISILMAVEYRSSFWQARGMVVAAASAVASIVALFVNAIEADAREIEDSREIEEWLALFQLTMTLAVAMMPGAGKDSERSGASAGLPAA